MKDIRVDENGQLRCWNCGGKDLLDRRTGRAHVTGWVTVGIGALATKKKLRCKACGKYNDTGSAKPYKGSALEVTANREKELKELAQKRKESRVRNLSPKKEEKLRKRQKREEGAEALRRRIHRFNEIRINHPVAYAAYKDADRRRKAGEITIEQMAAEQTQILFGEETDGFSDAQSSENEQAPANNLAKDLRELGQLRDDGILDEKEFSDAKRKLLGN
jgi:hypothetical protein